MGWDRDGGTAATNASGFFAAKNTCRCLEPLKSVMKTKYVLPFTLVTLVNLYQKSIRNDVWRGFRGKMREKLWGAYLIQRRCGEREEQAPKAWSAEPHTHRKHLVVGDESEEDAHDRLHCSRHDAIAFVVVVWFQNIQVHIMCTLARKVFTLCHVGGDGENNGLSLRITHPCDSSLHRLLYYFLIATRARDADGAHITACGWRYRVNNQGDKRVTVKGVKQASTSQPPPPCNPTSNRQPTMKHTKAADVCLVLSV